MILLRFGLPVALACIMATGCASNSPPPDESRLPTKALTAPVLDGSFTSLVFSLPSNDVVKNASSEITIDMSSDGTYGNLHGKQISIAELTQMIHDGLATAKGRRKFLIYVNCIVRSNHAGVSTSIDTIAESIVQIKGLCTSNGGVLGTNFEILPVIVEEFGIER